jgi:hypothetical protein
MVKKSIDKILMFGILIEFLKKYEPSVKMVNSKKYR